MDGKLFIYAGGVYHISWAIFDSFWPIVFQWKKRLSGLDDLNRALPYITSRLLIVLYLTISYISFIHTADLTEIRLGRTLLICVAIYWTVRFALQIRFFGFKKVKAFNMRVSDLSLPWPVNRLSNQALTGMFFIIFLIGIGLYLAPLFLTR